MDCKSITPSLGLHPELLKAAIRMAGVTSKGIAKELDVSPSTISLVIYGRGKSERVARRICEVVGKNAAELWPSVYPALEAEQVKRSSSRSRRTQK